MPVNSLINVVLVLASSMKLEFSLKDALPMTDHARDRLLAKVFAYRRDDKVAQKTNDEDFGLLYAYGMQFVPFRS